VTLNSIETTEKTPINIEETGEITLGSLFDGIGAVPYAASFFGIKTLWASEILPNAISITKRHFPDMEHLGDITKLDGGKIPPVRIIAFGSPCVSFSIAGPRTGFLGKSQIFMEAIRIIREMRCATHGKYPELCLFENVPGILSSGGHGRDYKTVLEAFTESKIPMPQSGRWANAGMVRGRGLNLAWIIKDASKHFRVPQRRRRLYLVCDFTGSGQRAAQILFITKSLSGYFAAREGQGEGTAAYAESRAGSAGGGESTAEISCYGETGRGYWQDGIQTIRAHGENHPSRPSNVIVAASGQVNAEITENIAPTLTIHHEQPYLCAEKPYPCAAFMAGQAKNARSIAYNESVSPTLKGSPSGLNQIPCVCEPTVYCMCSDHSNSMKSSNPNSGIYIAETSRTLDQNGGNPACQQGGMMVVEPQIARTLTARGDSSPCVDRGQNIVAIQQKAQPDARAAANSLTPWDRQGKRIFAESGVSPALAGADGGGGRNPAGFVLAETHPDVSGTLCASGAGLSRPAGMANETDLCVAVDCRNLNENKTSGTLQSKCTGGYSLNFINPVRTGYIIRRLTPTEAERLMSLPDGYTEYGHDGRLISDSARYQALGNSIVVNVLAYIMQNIAEELKNGKEDKSDG